MFQTVEQAADHITDILMEKSADGFMDTAKNLGTKALGGLRTAGRYMTERASDAQGGMKNTFHSALGGNDATHWGALGAIGLGGLGAVKGLIAPDEGKGRVRSMISNAALGALMGGAGGGAAGMLGKNPTLGGSLFKGNREKVNELEGNVNKAKSDLDVNRARAALGPVGAATAALGNADTTGFADAGITAGKELWKPVSESANNMGQSVGVSAGAQMARRRFQLGHLNSITTPDIQIGPKGWNKLNPFAGASDIIGNAKGTAMSTNNIDARTLQDAARKVMAASNASAPAPTTSPITPPLPGGSVNTANMPTPPAPTTPSVPPKLNIKDVIKELEQSMPAGNSGKSMLPDGFHAARLEGLQGYGASAKGISEIEKAILNNTGIKYNARVPLGATWKGFGASQLAGPLIASQLRNLPKSLERIRQIDDGWLSRPVDNLTKQMPQMGWPQTPPGELQIAEKALSDFQNRKR